MTSKISFFKLCLENMKRRMWLLVLMVLTYFISMPLALMIAVQNEESRRTTEYIEMFSGFFGMGFHSVLAAGFAILCAVAGFAWLFSKKKVDMYHSMPVRREKLFAAVYLNGILIWLVPYLVSVLVCLPMIGSHVRITGEMLSVAVITVVVNILFFLLFYNLMLTAVMLTGNMINCLITGGVLFVFAVMVRGLLECYLQYFMVTYYSDFNVLEELRFSSPLLAMIYFVEEFTKWNQRLKVYVTGGAFALYLLQCLVLSVIAGLAALVLYKKRPSEAAGKSIAFEKILNIYRMLLVIPLSLGSGIFFAALVDGGSDGVTTAWLIFGLIFGLVLSHGFIEVLFQMDIRAMFSYKRQLLATGVIVFLVAFSFKGDWYGIDSYLPEKEKIESMAVTVGSGYELYYNNYEEEEYVSGRDYILENMELTDIGAAYELAKLGMEYTNAWKRGSDEAEEDRISYLVRYRLKNGREVTKSYHLSRETAYPYIEQLYANEEFKNGIMGIVWENAAAATTLTIRDTDYNDQMLEHEWIAEFLEIYRREYESLTAGQILKDCVVAEFSYEINEYGENGMIESTIARLRDVCIYSGCAETLQFLKEHGIDTSNMTAEPDPENVSRIEIRSCSAEGEYILTGQEAEEWGTRAIIDDPEDIEKLLPYLVKDTAPYNGFKKYDDNFNAYVVETKSSEDHEEYRWVLLKEGSPIREIQFEITEE